MPVASIEQSKSCYKVPPSPVFVGKECTKNVSGTQTIYSNSVLGRQPPLDSKYLKSAGVSGREG